MPVLANGLDIDIGWYGPLVVIVIHQQYRVGFLIIIDNTANTGCNHLAVFRDANIVDALLADTSHLVFPDHSRMEIQPCQPLVCANPQSLIIVSGNTNDIVAWQERRILHVGFVGTYLVAIVSV